MKLHNQIAYITALIKWLDGNEDVEQALIEKIDYFGIDEIDLYTYATLNSNYSHFLEIYDNSRTYPAGDYHEVQDEMIRLLKANQEMLISALVNSKELDVEG